MPFTATRFGTHESAFGNMGIPPHDYVENTYSGGNLLTTVKYYRGGAQAAGKLVGQVELTYDSNNNLITVTRTH